MSADLADTCIVCLGDLRASLVEDPPPHVPVAVAVAVAADADDASTSVDAKKIATADDAAFYPQRYRCLSPEPISSCSQMITMLEASRGHIHKSLI